MTLLSIRDLAIALPVGADRLYAEYQLRSGRG